VGVAGRTQQEQIYALLAEISDEVEIDARTSVSADRLDVSSGLLQTHAF